MEILILFQCFQNCLKLESILTELSASNKALNCFPIIIGRRPNTTGNVLKSKENINNTMKESPSPSIQQPRPFLLSAQQSRAQSTPKARCHTPVTSRRSHVPGIGIATQV